MDSKSSDSKSVLFLTPTHKNLQMYMNVSLVRSPQGRAKFFDCSLTATQDTEQTV